MEWNTCYKMSKAQEINDKSVVSYLYQNFDVYDFSIMSYESQDIIYLT